MISRMTKSGLTRRQFSTSAAALGATLASGAAPAVIRAQDQVEVRLAHPTVNAEWDAQLETLVNQFMEATPGIRVTVEHRPGDQYWDKLQTEYAGNQAPDVSSINMDWTVPGASRGMFVDLKPLYERDSVDQSDLWYDMEGEWGYEGGMYGGILYAGGQNLYMNTDLLEAAGVALPTAEWTWDDLLATAQALTDESAQQYGVMFAPPSPPYWSTSFIHGAGGTVLNDARDQCTLDSAEAMAGLQWIVDLIHTHKVMPSPAALEGQDNPFIAGKVGFFFGGGWEEGTIRTAGFNWDFAPMPLHPTTGLKSSQLGSNAWALISTSEKQDETWELIKYISGPEGARAMMSYGIPGYTSVVESQEFKDIHAPQDVLVPVTDFMESGHDYYPTPDAGEWWGAVEDEFGPMWSGEDDVENTVRRTVERVDEIFSRRGEF
ncbi:MAG: sugar ABC transporter substrate-binding protein [Chloroflexota bacterium]|nr:sugar ABC transporter substrate-binding protein [Chloroflexota bacterium]